MNTEKDSIERRIDEVTRAHEKFKPDFERIRQDQEMLSGRQWPVGADPKDDRYVVNIVHRHIQQRTSALYAKQPTFVAKSRPRLDYRLWDGKAQSAQEALVIVQAAQQGIAEGKQPEGNELQIVAQAQQLVDELQQVQQDQAIRERIAKSLEMVYESDIENQVPNFKAQAKQWVTRALTCGIAWVRIDIQGPQAIDRQGTPTPEMVEQHVTHQMLDEKGRDKDTPEVLATAMQEVQGQQTMRQAFLMHRFPKTNSVIVDPMCTDLRTLYGCNWMAQIYRMTKAEIKQTFGADVQIKGHRRNSLMTPSKRSERSKNKDERYDVFEFFDRRDGLVYWMVGGYDKFLTAPTAPSVRVPRFFPFYALAFNMIEDEKSIYPPSDVRLMRHQQMEMNRAREALRAHRKANQPRYLADGRFFEDEDMDNIEDAQAHDVTQVKPVNDGNIAEAVVPFPVKGIEPALYDTNYVTDDVTRAVGAPEAAFGNAQGSATSQTIAETTRQTDLGSSVDQLDETLSDIARDGSQVLFDIVTPEQAMMITGPGGAWPT